MMTGNALYRYRNIVCIVPISVYYIYKAGEFCEVYEYNRSK